MAFCIAEVSFAIPFPFALYGGFFTFAHMVLVLGIPPGIPESFHAMLLFEGMIGVEVLFVEVKDALGIGLALDII